MQVAITGGIGEGKSTVLKMLAELGHPVASADEVARQIYTEPAIQARLGEIAALDEGFHPAELRDAIARSDEIRRSVNRLMHPLVMSNILLTNATFVEVPLLFEACLQSTFHQIWVVTCGEEEQRRRLLERYGDAAHVARLLSSQLPSRTKIPFADFTLRTNNTLYHVRRLLSSALAELGHGELRVE